MADDEEDNPFADPPVREQRSKARASRCRASEVILRVFDVDVELTLPSGAIHVGVVTLVREGEGYRTLGEVPEHWIDRSLLGAMLTLDQPGFDRACMALWLAALDVVP